MVKRLLILSLLVLALCGVGTMTAFSGGAPGAGFVPPPPMVPPFTGGPAATSYAIQREMIAPVPAQLRSVRVVAPYLAGIAWPRKPLAFLGNPQAWPDSWNPGRYEWLVPVVDVKKEHYWDLKLPFCCKSEKIPRCVYVKANYVKGGCGPGPVPVAPPPPMPMKVMK